MTTNAKRREDGLADADDLDALTKALEGEVGRLASAVAHAREVEWLPAPIPRPRDDTAERSQGIHGDPTAAVALDPRRLAVREQVARSAALLRDALVAVGGVCRGLERSVQSWEGTRDHGED